MKTIKRTKKQTVSKTHLQGSTCCPGSSGYSQSFIFGKHIWGCPGVPVHGGIPIVFISIHGVVTQLVNVSFLCVLVHEDTTTYLLCIFLQSMQIISNSHINDFCQIDTGFVIFRQEKQTTGMLKLGWGIGIGTN